MLCYGIANKLKLAKSQKGKSEEIIQVVDRIEYTLAVSPSFRPTDAEQAELGPPEESLTPPLALLIGFGAILNAPFC
jgi:hypothetical protein